MLSTIICHHCGKEVPHDPRIKKKQKYCSEEDCQRARRRRERNRRLRRISSERIVKTDAILLRSGIGWQQYADENKPGKDCK